MAFSTADLSLEKTPCALKTAMDMFQMFNPRGFSWPTSYEPKRRSKTIDHLLSLSANRTRARRFSQSHSH